MAREPASDRSVMNPGEQSFLVSLILFGALLGSPPAMTAALATETAPLDAAAVAALIEDAEAARRRAADLAAEWLNTHKLITQARQEAEVGNLQNAAELASQATREGELAAAQAEREAGAWQRRVVH